MGPIIAPILFLQARHVTFLPSGPIRVVSRDGRLLPLPLRQRAISQEKRMRRRPWRRSFFSHLVLILFFLPLVLFLCLSLLWVAFLGADAVPRVKRSAELPLRFRSDGSFKILQVIDVFSSIPPRNSTIAIFFIENCLY